MSIKSASLLATLLYASAALAQPVLNTIIGPKGSTAGGDLIFLGGTFPAGTPTITVDGVAGTLQAFNTTFILFRTPPGTGIDKPVRVSIGAINSNILNYSYDVPRITSISPPTGPTGGNIPVQISGQNFGPNCTVLIGGRPAPVVGTPTPTLITCTLPAGQGSALPISVTVDGQSSLLTPVMFSYNFPTLNSLAPQTGGTEGGTIVTLSGNNFGQTPMVKVGSSLVAPIPGSVSPTSLQFRTPSGAGALPVSVVIGAASSPSHTFTYDSPHIESIIPPRGSTAGGATIQIVGSNLGSSSTATILFDGVPIPVAPGSVGNNSLQFVLPEGEGTNKPIQVITDSGSSNTSTEFRFDAPDIAGVTPLRINAAGGDYFVLHGTNFGLHPVVVVDGTVVPTSVHSHSAITCVAPAGAPGTHAITVVVQTQNDSENALHYDCGGDFNKDGSIDFFDYLDFVDAYSAGC